MQVLHRDIKSANVLLSKAHDQAKICDVGLAHIIGTTGNVSSATQPVQGTFAYCSPEMLFNKRYINLIHIDGLPPDSLTQSVAPNMQ